MTIIRIQYRSAWLFGGLLSVLTLTLASIEIAHSRLPKQPAIFADVHVDPPLLKLLAGSPDDFEDDLPTHAEFVTKTTVLTAALKRPGIAGSSLASLEEPDAVRSLARQVRVECRGPKALRILYTGEPSSDAAALVNGIAAAYVDEILELTSRLRAERIDELERAQRDIKHRLGEKREAILRLDKLLAAAETAVPPGEGLADRPLADIWTRELDDLKKAIVEGEGIDGRITAELARLRNPPPETAVGLLRPAEF